VDQEAEPAERALPLQARDQVVGETDPLERRAEHELAWVEDEGLRVLHLLQFREFLHRLLHVDEGIAGVTEDAEETVDAHVHARRLHELLVEGIDADSSFLEEPADRPIGEDHARATL
jgi:hypothetical protein